MPIYAYLCSKCGKEFEELVYGKEEVRCPECASSKLERQLSTFAPLTGKAPERPAPGPCGTCGDPRGPGACAS